MPSLPQDTGPKGFPGGTRGKEPAYQCRRRKRQEFDPWVGKIPWNKAWQPTPVFLPEKSHGQRSLTGYSPRGHKESGTTERLNWTELKRCGFSPLIGKIPWSRRWKPTPVFLPGIFHGQGRLTGYSPWGLKELDTTECACTHTHIHRHRHKIRKNVYITHPMTIYISPGCCCKSEILPYHTGYISSLSSSC